MDKMTNRTVGKREVSGEVYGRCLDKTSRPETPINTGVSKENGRLGGVFAKSGPFTGLKWAT